MKDKINIILVTIGSIALFILMIWGFTWLFTKVPSVPETPSLRLQCLQTKSEEIYEKYAQCVKDAGGNNVRCGDSAREILCPFN